MNNNGRGAAVIHRAGEQRREGNLWPCRKLRERECLRRALVFGKEAFLKTHSRRKEKKALCQKHLYFSRQRSPAVTDCPLPSPQPGPLPPPAPELGQRWAQAATTLLCTWATVGVSETPAGKGLWRWVSRVSRVQGGCHFFY